MPPISLAPVRAVFDRLADYRLARRHGLPLPPEVRSFRAAYPRLVAELAVPYERYVREVSRPEAAISLECSALLLHLCRQGSPRAVLDMGSGFSSFVLRSHARQVSEAGDEPPRIWSLDDDPYWLEQTRELLAREGLSTDRLGSWEELDDEATPGTVNLILLDYGHPPERSALLPQLVPYVAAGATLLVDDSHKRKIRRAASRVIRRHDLSYLDLRRITRDVYGRSQWLVRR